MCTHLSDLHSTSFEEDERPGTFLVSMEIKPEASFWSMDEPATEQRLYGETI